MFQNTATNNNKKAFFIPHISDRTGKGRLKGKIERE
jgi:hypothetical protein